MPTLLAKASGEATSVAVEAGVTNDVTIPLFISRANARALALAGQLDSSALDDELAAALGAAASAAESAPAATSDVAESAEKPRLKRKRRKKKTLGSMDLATSSAEKNR